MITTAHVTITREPVRRYLDGLNAFDPASALSAYSPDAVVRYPGRPPMTVDEFRAHLEQFFEQVAGFEIAAQEVLETQHGVAARWTLTVTTKSGHTVTVPGMDSWVVSADRTIESVDVYFDPSPLQRALQS